MLPVFRFLFLARKAADPAYVAQQAAASQASFAAAWGDQYVVTVTPSGTDFLARAASLGGFPGWCKDVATGVGIDGEPRFHGFLVPDLDIGKATMDIVTLALSVGKPVYYIGPDNYHRVTATRENGRQGARGGPSWIDGWTLVY